MVVARKIENDPQKTISSEEFWFDILRPKMGTIRRKRR